MDKALSCGPAEPVWPLPQPGTPHTTASALFVDRVTLLKTEGGPAGRAPSPHPSPSSSSPGISAGRNWWERGQAGSRPAMSEPGGRRETAGQSLNTQTGTPRLQDKGKRNRHPKLWLLVLAQPRGSLGTSPYSVLVSYPRSSESIWPGARRPTAASLLWTPLLTTPPAPTPARSRGLG